MSSVLMGVLVAFGTVIILVVLATKWVEHKRKTLSRLRNSGLYRPSVVGPRLVESPAPHSVVVAPRSCGSSGPSGSCGCRQTADPSSDIVDGIVTSAMLHGEITPGSILGAIVGGQLGEGGAMLGAMIGGSLDSTAPQEDTRDESGCDEPASATNEPDASPADSSQDATDSNYSSDQSTDYGSGGYDSSSSSESSYDSGGDSWSSSDSSSCSDSCDSGGWGD